MDWGTVFVGLVQLVVSVVLAAVVAYLGLFLYERATSKVDEWAELRQGNTAFGIVLGAVVLGVALIVRPALTVPAASWDVGTQRVFYALLAMSGQLAVGLLLAVAAVLFALWLFARLTGALDEEAALKEGNQAVAWLLAGVVIAVALLVSSAVEALMRAVVPGLF